MKQKSEGTVFVNNFSLFIMINVYVIMFLPMILVFVQKATILKDILAVINVLFCVIVVQMEVRLVVVHLVYGFI